MTPEAPPTPTTMQMVITEPPPQPRPPLREMLEVLKATDAALVTVFARQIVEREVAATLFEQDIRLAKSFALSGLFDSLRGQSDVEAMAKAMTFVQLGRSWNMTPADSMQFINFYKGRPSVANEYAASRMRDAGLDWRIEWHQDTRGDCIGCTLFPKRKQADGSYEPIREIVNGVEVDAAVSFTKTDAQNVPSRENHQDITLDQKSTYRAYAQDMYYWRCIARLKRRYCTNIFSIIPMEQDRDDEEQPPPQKALAPAPERMTVTAADLAPPPRRQRQEKPAPPPPAAKKDDLVPVLEESLRAVNGAPRLEVVSTREAEPTGPAPPEMTQEQIFEEMGALRTKADGIGAGLFMAQVRQSNPQLNVPSDVKRLPMQDLVPLLDSLRNAAEKTWAQSGTGQWMPRLF